MGKREITTGLVHHEQEMIGTYKFDGSAVMTMGFVNLFDDQQKASRMAIEMLNLIWDIRDSVGADYLQVFTYDGTKIFVIDDEEHFTFLLAEEY